MANLITIM